MVPELVFVTIFLGALYGLFVVLYAAPKGYLGHPRRKVHVGSVQSIESSTTPTEQAAGVRAVVATTVSEPASSPFQAIYETVQPTPTPVQYAASSVTSFGAPTISNKPIRTYRRRIAPVWSTAASKAPLKAKTKKR
jgi:hypothetical protein